MAGPAPFSGTAFRLCGFCCGASTAHKLKAYTTYDRDAPRHEFDPTLRCSRKRISSSVQQNAVIG
jgi:hypothetical protein